MTGRAITKREDELSAHQAQALALQFWALACSVGNGATGFRMLVEGLRWADEIENGLNPAAVKRHPFVLLARMFLDDNESRLSASGNIFFAKPATDLLRRVSDLV